MLPTFAQNVTKICPKNLYCMILIYDGLPIPSGLQKSTWAICVRNPEITQKILSYGIPCSLE